MKRFLPLLLILALVFTFASCTSDNVDRIIDDANGIVNDLIDYVNGDAVVTEPPKNLNAVSVDAVGEFSGVPYVTINDNKPAFTDEELTTQAYEFYSELDSMGRCGYTMACIGVELMPTEERGSIGQVKPSGWQTVKYDIVDGKYLYNRCHLIGFQLTGENANNKNLITGTRYMNVDGMLPFENMVADYIKDTENHVIYRVTPIFKGLELVARGVQIEAYSVEDDGEGICFNVYVYNNQPGITIDYASGFSWLSDEKPPEITSVTQPQSNPTPPDALSYVLNTSTKKFHTPDCSSVKSMSETNKQLYAGTRDSLVSDGYTPCGVCKP